MNNDCKECDIKDTLKEHKEILKEHDDKIEALKMDNVELKTEMKNLCSKVGDLIITLRWNIGIIVTVGLAILGFWLKK